VEVLQLVDIVRKNFCGYLICEIQGEVTHPKDLAKIGKVVEKEIHRNRENIAIDLHRCEYMNSGLMGFFLGWKQKMDLQQKKFCIIEPGKEALEVLDLCGIPKVIPIYKNEVEFQKNG